jgi:hypothetical protein
MTTSNTTTTAKFVLAFDSGAKGTRYIDDMDEKYGTSFSNNAKVFDTKEEAQKFNDDKGYLCWVEELTEEILTYDVVFNSDDSSNNMGFALSLDEAKNWISNNNASNNSYFADYKGGTVSVICNENELTVFETAVL